MTDNENKSAGTNNNTVLMGKKIILGWRKSLFLKGQASLKEKDFDQAIDAFSQVVKSQNPYVADAYYFRGYAYEQQGDLEHAIADYTEAGKLNSADPWPYYNRGKVYNSKRDYTKAVEDFSAALALFECLATVLVRGAGK